MDKDNYLLELSRYVVLNPVRAKMVDRPERWKWSSYCGTVGRTVPPQWLASERMLSFFGNRQSKYREFVLAGIGKASVWEDLKGQIYLGSKDFLERMQNLVGRKVVRGIAKAQTTPLRPSVDDIVATIGRRYRMAASDVLDKRRPEAYWLAIFLMRRAANLSLQEVADLAKVSPARISQIQSKIERGKTRAKMAQVLKDYKLKD